MYSKFNFNKNTIEKIPEILYVSHFVNTTKRSYNPHSHYHTEIIYNVTHDLELQAKEKKYQVKAGEIIIIPQFALHYEYFAHKNNAETYTIGIENISPCTTPDEIVIIKSEHATEIGSFIIDIFNSIDKKLPYTTTISKFYQLVDFLIVNSICQSKNTEELNALFPTHVKNYIKNSFVSINSISEIAEEFKVTPEHIIRVFKKNFNITPNKYIILKRCELAASLLKSTDTSISNICFSVGFNNLSYFIRTFKKIYNLSPNDYRQQIK